MAAPDSKTVLNMTGIWQINRTLSDDINSLFVLQGVTWLLRKLISFTTVQLFMKQAVQTDVENLTTTIHVTQIVRPGNFNSEDTYFLDSVSRECTVPIFGKIAVSAEYVTVTSIEDAEVRERFAMSGEPQTVLVDTVRSVGNGWVTTSVWGFEEVEGLRHHVRYSVTKKGDQELKLKIVYDFLGEP